MASDAELIRRAEDLLERSKRRNMLTHSLFLTPAEQYDLNTHFANRADCRMVMSGGFKAAERKIAFFLPEWYEESEPANECIKAVELIPGFGHPGHRDYLGSVLALGIKREWIGDIVINDDRSFIICLDSVQDTIILDLDHVSRFGVKRSPIYLEQIPEPIIKKKEMTFTVQSPRLDSIAGSIFGISRSLAAKMISEGIVSYNYSICTSASTSVKSGDVISIRGKGKGIVTSMGGLSKKGRLYITAELYL